HISIIFGESLYTGKSYRDVFTQLVSNLVLSAELDKLIPLMSPNEPNTVQILGNREHISAKGTKLTKPIELTKYHMYVNFSKIGLYNQIKKLAELTGKKVIFERW
ncbi:GIY-YIG nuclease family protein, partial [Enterococcus faecalis]|nr:GIY-YIG nuclease family protein [Enterococcus faecalis]